MSVAEEGEVSSEPEPDASQIGERGRVSPAQPRLAIRCYKQLITARLHQRRADLLCRALEELLAKNDAKGLVPAASVFALGGMGSTAMLGFRRPQ